MLAFDLFASVPRVSESDTPDRVLYQIVASLRQGGTGQLLMHVSTKAGLGQLLTISGSHATFGVCTI